MWSKKIGREHPAVQLFCNVYTVLLWLCLTFILLFCLVQDSWLRLTKEYFYSKSGFTIRCSSNFHKNPRKTLVMESLSVCDFIKKWPQHWCYQCEVCKIFKNTYFVKHMWTAASEYLWCNKVLQYPCSIKIWLNLIKKTYFFIKTCSFLILECCLQFSDNFLHC